MPEQIKVFESDNQRYMTFVHCIHLMRRPLQSATGPPEQGQQIALMKQRKLVEKAEL